MNQKYLLRLDDWCEYRNIEQWERMEALLGKYGIAPIIGIIPNVSDTKLMNYDYDESFVSNTSRLVKKHWVFALHGYNHLYETSLGGLNPVNKKSEFAGLTLDRQCEKISLGLAKLKKDHNIIPDIFFAPSHTYDDNTLKALCRMSNIRIISDTFALDVYEERGFTYIPQQCGMARQIPFFKTLTFCYHPNTMTNQQFVELEQFLIKNQSKFIAFSKELMKHRHRSIFEYIMQRLYYCIKAI